MSKTPGVLSVIAFASYLTHWPTFSILLRVVINSEARTHILYFTHQPFLTTSFSTLRSLFCAFKATCRTCGFSAVSRQMAFLPQLAIIKRAQVWWQLCAVFTILQVILTCSPKTKHMSCEVQTRWHACTCASVEKIRKEGESETPMALTDTV